MVRGERTREVTDRHRVVSINGNGSSKLRGNDTGEGKPEKRRLGFIFPWCVSDWRGMQRCNDGQMGGGTVIGRSETERVEAGWAELGCSNQVGRALLVGYGRRTMNDLGWLTG
jgi:hypothetical protein